MCPLPHPLLPPVSTAHGDASSPETSPHRRPWSSMGESQVPSSRPYTTTRNIQTRESCPPYKESTPGVAKHARRSEQGPCCGSLQAMTILSAAFGWVAPNLVRERGWHVAGTWLRSFDNLSVPLLPRPLSDIALLDTQRRNSLILRFWPQKSLGWIHT